MASKLIWKCGTCLTTALWDSPIVVFTIWLDSVLLTFLFYRFCYWLHVDFLDYTLLKLCLSLPKWIYKTHTNNFSDIMSFMSNESSVSLWVLWKSQNLANDMIYKIHTTHRTFQKWQNSQNSNILKFTYTFPTNAVLLLQQAFFKFYVLITIDSCPHARRPKTPTSGLCGHHAMVTMVGECVSYTGLPWHNN